MPVIFEGEGAKRFVALDGAESAIRLVEDRRQLEVLDFRAGLLGGTRRALDCVASLASCQCEVRTIAMTGEEGGRPSTRRSRPLSAVAANATSSTPAANSPTVSSDQEKHFMPTVGSSRYEGLKPATPQ
jgi:hypothetical protein